MPQGAKRPPGPDGYPLVGSMVHYAREPFAFQEQCVAEYGDVVRIRGVRNDVYLLAHPEYVEQVLKTDHDKYGKAEGFKEIFGNGLTALEGEFWEEQRKLIQPAFFRDRIAEHVDVITGHADARADAMERAEVFAIEDQMSELTLRTLSDTLFGSTFDYDDHDIESCVDAMNKKFDPLNRQIPTAIPTRSNRRFKSGLRTLRELVGDVVENERQSDDTATSMVSMLVEARRDESVEMDDETLRDHLITMIFGGSDTTALTLTYAWYLLSKRPSAEEDFHAEIDDVMGNRLPTMADLADLDYTEKIIKETLRLYCPANGIVREAREDVEIGGYAIPEGSRILLTPWLPHLDERFFDDPEAFRPERWTDEFEREIHDFAYFPFGGGPRRCIGERLAMIEAKLAMATIGRRLRFERAFDRDELDLIAGVTAKPKNPVEMRAETR